MKIDEKFTKNRLIDETINRLIDETINRLIT
jgi:hypothetical protein